MRSKVQIFPGPPHHGQSQSGIGPSGLPAVCAGGLPSGAIAQLGERVLCKHEVVGSIPSGSTRPRLCRAARVWEWVGIGRWSGFGSKEVCRLSPGVGTPGARNRPSRKPFRGSAGAGWHRRLACSSCHREEKVRSNRHGFDSVKESGLSGVAGPWRGRPWRVVVSQDAGCLTAPA